MKTPNTRAAAEANNFIPYDYEVSPSGSSHDAIDKSVAESSAIDPSISSPSALNLTMTFVAELPVSVKIT